jgi:hypothetical protein
VARTTMGWSAVDLDTLDQSTCEAGQRLSRYGSVYDGFGGCCLERLCSRHRRRRLGLMLTLILLTRVLASQARGCHGTYRFRWDRYRSIDFDVRYSTVSG